MQFGLAETEAVVPPGNEKRIDLWFVPENNERTVDAPVFTGVLAQMAAKSAAIELWSEPPSGDDFHKALGKREAWHDILELRDKRSWERPPLWHVCAGKPLTVIEEFGLFVTAIPGCYRPPAPGWRVVVVVLGELPTTRDTILLRLLGRGRVRRDALRELESLPDDAWEKPLAEGWLVRLGLEVPSNVEVVPEEREFFMDIQAWYEEHKRSLYEEHKRTLRDEFRDEFMREIEARLAEERRQAEVQLAEERRQVEVQLAEERRQAEARIADARLQVEVKSLVHQFEHRLGRALSSSERDTLTARVKAHGSDHIGDLVLDLSTSDLVAWLEQDKLG